MQTIYLVNDGQRTFTDFLTNKISSKLKFYDIEKEHIIKIINDMKPKTSSGYDGISMKIIKSVKHILAHPLAMIINQMLHTGIFPDLLKIAKVTPIYKKDDETILSNYRPISLLLVISKFFEKVIFSQTYEYFQREKLFYEGQYGFRKGHSTEFAALETVDKLITDMDKGETPFNIYLDLSKAFDTLNHDILLHKLEYYEVSDSSLDLFNNYLTDRKQYVEYDDVNSDTLHISNGVPQGSILGPLLFIIYINDMSKVSKIFSLIMYADDTTLSSILKAFQPYTTTHNIDELINSELRKVSEWLIVNKLSLNVSMTNFSLFHTHYSTYNYNPKCYH